MSFGDSLNDDIGCERIQDLNAWLVPRQVLSHYRAVFFAEGSKSQKKSASLTADVVLNVFANMGNETATKQSVIL
jgi:hypothetical protein